MTKIKHGKVTGYDAEIDDDVKKGQDWVMLTVRVKNGSDTKLDTYSSWNMTYGADGDEANVPYLTDAADTTTMYGKIMPGKSKTAGVTSSSRRSTRRTRCWSSPSTTSTRPPSSPVR